MSILAPEIVINLKIRGQDHHMIGESCTSRLHASLAMWAPSLELKSQSLDVWHIHMPPSRRARLPAKNKISGPAGALSGPSG